MGDTTPTRPAKDHRVCVRRPFWFAAAVFAALLAALPAAALLAGDVDGSNTVDSLDVQIAINAALRLPVPTTYWPDVDYSGAVDALDVQLVINAALRLPVDIDGDGICDAADVNLFTHIDSFAINGGAATANDRSVYLNHVCIGAPTDYMASESADFAGAPWRPYSTAPLFVLSEGNGTKTVYFKVRRFVKDSNTLSDTIALSYTPTPPTLQSFTINNGAPAAAGRTIILNNICVGGPDECLASESASFEGATWQPYSSAPSFVLTTPGNGVKTVYLKTRNALGESATLSDQISLNEPVPPVVTAFHINNGDAQTGNRIVTLHNVCLNAPTQYMASGAPSFSGASWQPYAAAPAFVLPAGNGTKTVYFKTRNAYGESSVAQDAIELKELQLEWSRSVFDLSRRDSHAAVALGDAVWVLGGKGNDGAKLNDVWRSEDGATWTLATPAAPWAARTGHAAVAFHGRIYVIGGFSAAGAQRDVWSSNNGVEWRIETLQAPWSARSAHAALVYQNKLWVIGGFDVQGNRVNDVWHSDDGVTWLPKTAAAAWTGRDGITAATTGEGTPDARMWILGGRTASEYPVSEVWWSADGSTWTQAAAPGWEARHSHATVVTSAGAMWVIGGIGANYKYLRDAWHSTNGATWTRATGVSGAPWSGRGKHAAAVTAGDVLWVLGGEDVNVTSLRDVWHSTDGNAWALANVAMQWDARQDHAAVVSTGAIGSYLWVLGGRDDAENRLRDVWRTGDGATWTRTTASAEWSARAGLAATAAADGKLWVFGGSTDVAPAAVTNDVWHSTNGATWLRQTAGAEWPARAYHASASFLGKLWIAGGMNSAGAPLNDVWTSDTGATWTNAGPAPWPARSRHSMIVFLDKLWVVGGMDANWTPFNDVWHTQNGTSWTKASGAGAPWSARAAAAMAVFDGKLWLLGGGRYTIATGIWATYADAWHSADGQTWALALTGAASPAGRYGCAAAAYDGRLWLLGGLISGAPIDVWHASLAP